MTETRTWTVEVWDREPGSARYIDAHPEHRSGTDWYERQRARGAGLGPIHCGTVEPVGRVFRRVYKRRANAERMADCYRKLPGLYVDVNPGFSLRW